MVCGFFLGWDAGMDQRLNTVANDPISDGDICALTPLVDSVCRRYLRRRHDVEEAIQETFVKMLTHGMTLACPRLRGWLSVTAGSTCIDLIRRSQSEQRRLMGWAQISPLHDDEPSHNDEHARLRIEAAMGRLDEASRRLMVERYYRSTPLRVIADRAGVSVSTVSRWAAAALKRLAQVLNESDGVEHDSVAVN
jgi:RNA polymerase sigma factor (sigma-70 family)